jgi:hypothetical protein
VVTGVSGKLVSMEKGANASYKLTKKPAALKLISKFNTALNDFVINFKS